jgi:invasion protein IalB
MKSITSMLAVIVPLILTPVILSPGAAFAQQMQPHDEMMMMHGTMLEGVITQIRYVSCESTPQSCQAIIQVTPASKGQMSSQETMMHESTTMGGNMMMAHPVTVIIVPGTTLMWQNSSLPLTRLKVGDTVACEYVTLSGMNVVTKVTLTGMGHM